MVACGSSFAAADVRWRHPAGIVTAESIAEIKSKIAGHDWARRTYAKRTEALAPWLAVPSAKLRSVFPKNRGNVYHNFSCPKDRARLVFTPFESDEFLCPVCGARYASGTDAGIYPRGARYSGTIYDGWACMFYQCAGAVAADLGLIARVGNPAGDSSVRKGVDVGRCVDRGIEILMLYADTIEGLKTKVDPDPQMSVLLTYHREGDNKVLNDLACAYELLRDRMTRERRERFERVVLERMYNDLMREPIYRYNHNNLYQWHRTIVQVGVSLEREDLIDWSFGYGAVDPEHRPEHHSIRRLIATHFKPDGAYWEMCSGYHLYPLHAFCELAVISHNLVRMDPKRFPPERYDLTDRSSAGGQVIHRALEWFLSMAMPDRTMPTIGDSPSPCAGLDDYYNTAEVGYRYFGIEAVGDYERFRNGERSWAGLLYGAPEIVSTNVPKTSACLSSGWVSLRNEWRGNRVWVGLNALIPGGGHQHADRLNLLTYSHGKLLALEKATPYNESTTRVLGTLSLSHNTVTVDRTSQKQGEALSGEAIPQVAYFVDGPIAKFAELRGDHIYGQTTVYRRSVALIEDVIVDLFRVRGGKVHDWMVHHAGPAPRFSMSMSVASFEPAEWLHNGTKRILCGKPPGIWDARWTVDDVTSRLTMMPAADTSVYALETYPVDNAVITPKNPPCRTLCVRRRNDAPFLAVWDAWRDAPNVQTVRGGGDGESMGLKTASNRYVLRFGPGTSTFEGGVSLKTDAVFCVMRNRDAFQIIGGTHAEIQTPEGTLHVTADRAASVSAEFADGVATLGFAGNIDYDTYGGGNHYRAPPAVKLTIEGDLWKVTQQVRRAVGPGK